MNVTVNGDSVHVPDHYTLQDLLVQLGLADKRVAVERNEEIVPRSQLSNAVLTEADRLEIVHAIGGG